MKHGYNELFKIKGLKNYYTENAIKELGVSIDEGRNPHLKDGDAYRCISHQQAGGAKGFFRLWDGADSIRIVYTVGETLWFDTKEERDAYREEYQAARNLAITQNKIIKRIDEYLRTLTPEQLEEMAQKLGV